MEIGKSIVKLSTNKGPLLLFLALVACGHNPVVVEAQKPVPVPVPVARDDGNGHSQIAKRFTELLNFDSGYIIEVVNMDARDGSYIVINDSDLESYSAYDLSGYVKGGDIDKYLEENEKSIYYDLEPEYDAALGKEIYKHFVSGIQFSKTEMLPADPVKAQELVDSIKLSKATEQLIREFGLHPRRAKEIAMLALQLYNTNFATMTVYQYDQYSKALLGVSITDIKSSVVNKQSGNENALDLIYRKIAKVNGISKVTLKKIADAYVKKIAK